MLIAILILILIVTIVVLILRADLLESRRGWRTRGQFKRIREDAEMEDDERFWSDVERGEPGE